MLKRGRARLLRQSGSPIVYGDSVDCVVGSPPPKPGDCVVVADGTRTPLAWGTFNPTSMYRVRILQSAADVHNEAPELVLDVRGVVHERVRRAFAMRKALGCCDGDNAAYRLINSEGDGVSGVVVDVFADAAVVQASALWAERHRTDIEDALRAVPGVRRVLWRRVEAMLRLETEESEYDATVLEKNDESHDDGADTDTVVEVVEDGLCFAVDLRRGQKTGFYCDQRDNRRWLRSLPLNADSRVLDLCCYTGGFSLAAAAAGAGHVLGVDSSEPAVELAAQNADRNDLGAASFRSGDAIAVARELKAQGESFDVVVLDPPKLAPSTKALAKARSKYESFNVAALALVKPGGVLITCSCSGAVARAGALRDFVEAAARRAGRSVQLVRRSGAAVDHPVSAGHAEGTYLDCLCYVVT